MEVYGFFLIIISSSHFSAIANRDEDASCVYRGDCVLQCSFTPGSDFDHPNIRWTKTEGGLTVHSFHHGQNHELDQYPEYSGRTSLFEDEINRGNASLLLKQVTVKDQGRYLCWANGQVTYVNMKVFAPVSEVHVDLKDDKLICQADHIYPQPEVTWIMDPEPEPPTKPDTSIFPFETGLFSVNSSVPLPIVPFQYSCNVRTAYSWLNKTYKSDEASDRWSYIQHSFIFLFLILFAGAIMFTAYKWIERNRSHPRATTNTFQHIYSKFEEKWKKTTDTSSDGTVDGPNPEEDHLGPEETETEL